MTQPERVDAPGLPADWLNAWLAAIGVTVLLPEVRLSWTDDVVPHAVFWAPAARVLADAIAERLPSVDDVEASPIACQHPGANLEFPRQVSLASYRERARLERRTQGWSLAASVSDLLANIDEVNLPHGAFDPPAPRGETLWSRALKCRQLLDCRGGLSGAVGGTLQGRPCRVAANGLGFDSRRLVPGAVIGANVQVDPVVELLVWSALRHFPFRGNGRILRQRGFRDRPSQRGAFTWWAWGDPLDAWAIDACLDRPVSGGPRWQLVPYVVPPPDNTRAYFSERVS